jgi:hypothetical protein
MLDVTNVSMTNVSRGPKRRCGWSYFKSISNNGWYVIYNGNVRTCTCETWIIDLYNYFPSFVTKFSLFCYHNFNLGFLCLGLCKNDNEHQIPFFVCHDNSLSKFKILPTQTRASRHVSLRSTLWSYNVLFKVLPLEMF